MRKGETGRGRWVDGIGMGLEGWVDGGRWVGEDEWGKMGSIKCGKRWVVENR